MFYWSKVLHIFTCLLFYKCSNIAVCLCSGGLLSIQVNDTGGIYSAVEGAVAYSQRFHTDHENGAGKIMSVLYIVDGCCILTADDVVDEFTS